VSFLGCRFTTDIPATDALPEKDLVNLLYAPIIRSVKIRVPICFIESNIKLRKLKCKLCAQPKHARVFDIQGFSLRE
jgi:hypothetical protein